MQVAAQCGNPEWELCDECDVWEALWARSTGSIGLTKQFAGCHPAIQRDATLRYTENADTLTGESCKCLMYNN